MNEKIKILFIRPFRSTFIQKDLELLDKHFDVRIVDFVLNRKMLWDTLASIFKIYEGVLWANITFSWFADIHAFVAVYLSKIFGKKSIVVVGGYEVANLPEIGYGLMVNPCFFRMVKYLLSHTDRVLTVDEGLKIDAIKNACVTGNNIQVVPTGYNHEIFRSIGEKEDLVITVSIGDTWQRVRLKGLDTFVRSAGFLLDVKFLLIGVQGEALKKLQEIASPNIEFRRLLPPNEIIPYYQKAKVYCQLSMREGLPNALCEAMLCECVPVGTNAQGVKTAIGDTGFYVPYGDPEATAEAIKKAMKSKYGTEARNRIILNFPMVKRENKIIEIIHNI